MERRRQIDGQRSSQRSRAKLLDWREMPDHRVVDQDIDRIEAAEEVGHHAFDRRALRQIGRNDDVSTQSGDRIRLR